MAQEDRWECIHCGRKNVNHHITCWRCKHPRDINCKNSISKMSSAFNETIKSTNKSISKIQHNKLNPMSSSQNAYHSKTVPIDTRNPTSKSISSLQHETNNDGNEGDDKDNIDNPDGRAQQSAIDASNRKQSKLTPSKSNTDPNKTM